MGALRSFAAALALVAAVLSCTAQGRGIGGETTEHWHGRATERWRGLASEAADRFGLPAEWVMRVIEAESAGRTELGGRPITSHAGAMGLMQIMPATWAGLRARYGLGSDPHDPRDNIFAGTAYLRAMYDCFGYPGLFGAYNAGPGRYGEYLSAGRPLPRETRAYMAKIAGGAPERTVVRAAARRAAPLVRSPQTDAIFFARRAAGDAVSAIGDADMPRGDPRLAGRGLRVPAAPDGLFALRRDSAAQDR